MRLSRRVLASILLVIVVVPRAYARTDGDVCTSDAPETPPAPVAPVPPPPSLAKIEWRDVFWGDRHGRVRHAEKPYRNGRLLEGEALYVALDRPDLAAAYRKRRETKIGLGIAGGIFLAGAGIAMAIAVHADQMNDGHDAPVGALIGVWASTLLGGGLGIGGTFLPADVVSDDELHRLVDAYNQAR